MNTKMTEQVARTLLEKCKTGNENEINELVKLSYTELYMLFINTGFTEKEFEELHKNKYLESTDATLDYLDEQVELLNEMRFTMKNGEDENTSPRHFSILSLKIVMAIRLESTELF